MGGGMLRFPAGDRDQRQHACIVSKSVLTVIRQPRGRDAQLMRLRPCRGIKRIRPGDLPDFYIAANPQFQVRIVRKRNRICTRVFNAVLIFDEKICAHAQNIAVRRILPVILGTVEEESEQAALFIDVRCRICRIAALDGNQRQHTRVIGEPVLAEIFQTRGRNAHLMPLHPCGGTERFRPGDLHG